MLQSLSKFSIRLRQQLFFHNQSIKPIIPRISNNPIFIPPVNPTYSFIIDNYVSDCTQLINNLRIHSSLSFGERSFLNVLKELKSNMNIVIRPADKNLGTTVLSSHDYIVMCNNILNDTSTYKLLSDNPKTLISRSYAMLRLILNNNDVLYNNKRNKEGNRFQLSKLAKSLLQLQFDSKLQLCGRFYCIPKIHKTPIAGRPIVPSINTCTYYTSIYLHNLLLPLVKKLPTVCFSSKQVIMDIHKGVNILNGACLLCADVRSLYPSIPTDYGMAAIKFVLESYNFPNGELTLTLQLLHWVLTNNYLEFMDKVYLQIKGTAMGTPVSVIYANIVLYYLESQCNFHTAPIYYARYIDDIFAICVNTSSANNIVECFNSQCSSIQLEQVTIGQSGIFLDLKLSIVNNAVQYTLYQKELNNYQYIPPTTMHGQHVLKNTIINELKRYRLYCSLEEDFISIARLFHKRLVQRGYKTTWLRICFRNIPSRKLLLDKLVASHAAPTIKKVAKPVMIILRHKLNKGTNLRTNSFSLPLALRNHPMYIKVFGNSDIVIGSKYSKCMGRYFLHNKFNPTPHSNSI